MTGWTNNGRSWMYTDKDGDSLQVWPGATGTPLFLVDGRNGCQVSGEDLTTLIDLLTQARDTTTNDVMEERARVLATEILHAHGAYVTGEQVRSWLDITDEGGYAELHDRVITLVITARVEVTWGDES